MLLPLVHCPPQLLEGHSYGVPCLSQNFIAVAIKPTSAHQLKMIQHATGDQII